ncbi:MAG: PorT family protein [Chitinophagales bacterium]|nr:PorT family protein [Chitinophagales bacterium]
MRKFSILIVILFNVVSAFSQEKGTFRGYISTGFTINQISGDSVGGFNYWGYTGGLGTYFMISNKISANMEINYSMRGGSGEQFNEFNQFVVHRTIHTNYIEVPIMINYHDHKIARFGAGLVVSNLISTTQWYNLKQVRNERTENYYRPIDLGFIASVAFDIKKHFGFNIRMIHSIIPTNRYHTGDEDQYHITLSARGIYYF